MKRMMAFCLCLLMLPMLTAAEAPEEELPAAALEACFGQEDCYLLVARLRQDWTDRLDALVDDGDMMSILLEDIRFPEAGSVPYLGGLSAAQHHLLALPGWDEEVLMRYAVCFSAYMVPEDVGEPVWLFLFDGEGQEAPLKDGGIAPVYFSVLVDAMRGKVIDARFEYEPTVFAMIEHITRPSAFVD